ncbi:MAG: beta-ketoacyl synthase N-terminal-like domain-containing protein [Chitinivibrionales bacterium]
MKNRVVVTGLGVICAGGADLESFAQTITGARQCFTQVSDPRAPHINQYAGLIEDEQPLRTLNPDIRSMDKHIQYACYAADAALDHAGLDPQSRKEAGLICSTCSGPMMRIEEFYETAEKSTIEKDENAWHQRRYYSVTRVLCYHTGVRGPVSTVTTACSAGTLAVGSACDIIGLGEAQIMLVGGADSFSISTLAGFNGLKATSETTCAPFSKPVGMNLGEGAGFLVLESLESAKRRGVRIYAEIVGFGSSNDAYHCSAPDPSGRGQSLAMQRALAYAGKDASAVGYINAHGTGTAANDKAETKAMVRIFGSDTSVAVSSTKSMIGHCLGAAGAIELIATILCHERDCLPPTANFSEPRDGCTFDYVPKAGRRWGKNSLFMNNNFAFGGNNASLVVTSKPEEVKKREEKTVYITGFGIVSPAGAGYEPLVEVWENDQRLLRTRTLFNVSFDLAMVPAINPREIDRRLDLRSVDRGGYLATAAARLAMLDAGYSPRRKDAAECGLYVGQTHSVIWAESQHIRDLIRHDYMNNHVQAFPYIVPNSIAGTVSRLLELGGHNSVISAGAGSDGAAVGSAFQALQAGHGDVIIAGGVDEMSEAVLFDLQQVSDAPWVSGGIGEGAVFAVLETEHHARIRGVEPLVRICSHVSGAETESVWGEAKADTIARVIRKAIRSADIDSGDIGLICIGCGGQTFNTVAGELEIGHIPVINLNKNIGYIPGCAQIMSLATAINSTLFEKCFEKNYILSISATTFGFTYATIFQNVTRKSFV